MARNCRPACCRAAPCWPTTPGPLMCCSPCAPIRSDFLTRQDWCGAVYAADGVEMPPGVLPRSALLADHARAAHVLFTLRTNPGLSPAGLAGTTLYDGPLEIGAGIHGGLSTAELHTVLMLGGSMIRSAG